MQLHHAFCMLVNGEVASWLYIYHQQTKQSQQTVEETEIIQEEVLRKVMKLSQSVPNHKKEIKCNFLLVKTTAKKGKWIHGFPTHHTGLFVALHDN